MNPAAEIDELLISDLHDAGLSTRAIANHLGNVGKSTVAKTLKHLNPRKSTEIFKAHRADIFAEVQRKIFSTLDMGELKKMPARDRIMAAGLIYDKERMERGQNDSNVKPMVQVNVMGSQVQVVTGNTIAKPK